MFCPHRQELMAGSRGSGAGWREVRRQGTWQGTEGETTTTAAPEAEAPRARERRGPARTLAPFPVRNIRAQGSVLRVGGRLSILPRTEHATGAQGCFACVFEHCWNCTVTRIKSSVYTLYPVSTCKRDDTGQSSQRKQIPLRRGYCVCKVPFTVLIDT